MTLAVAKAKVVKSDEDASFVEDLSSAEDKSNETKPAAVARNRPVPVVAQVPLPIQTPVAPEPEDIEPPPGTLQAA